MALDPRIHAAQFCRRALRPDDRSLRPDAVGQHCHHPVGEHGGFDAVAALARNAGVKSAQGTPSMPIGSYDATPSTWQAPTPSTPTAECISIRGFWPACAHRRHIIEDYTPTTRRSGCARCYLTTSMMEAVMNNGTAASVRGLGLPSAAARRAPITTHGSRALQATCFASCGWQ